MDNSKVKCDEELFSKTEYILEKYVKNKKYLELSDFDDHFSDVAKCDFRN